LSKNFGIIATSFCLKASSFAPPSGASAVAEMAMADKTARRGATIDSNMSQSSSNLPAPAGGDFILYGTDDGRTRIEVRFSGETVWLSLNQMADLFQRNKSVISKHIKNVFEEGELKPDSVVAKFATTAADGKTYQVDYSA
jgi:hypothetical protein